jgi:Cysteine dioxygenase type I
MRMTALLRGAQVRRDLLNSLQLVELVRFIAAEVDSGAYPFVRYELDERWHRRIYRDWRVDVWLISWMPSQGTQLHDHGGSAGAFTVVRGQLTESRITRAARGAVLRDRTLAAGRSVGFDARYVHDVRNIASTAALSVHAYSPALESMSYYDIEDGVLRKLATVITDDPEQEYQP